ncbi:MAG: ATP-binding protein [Anaerolineae bacterium]|nr:ATP-binding protein [Anaerolineae bacterium]
MIRFGYGMAHFPALRNEGRWYVDRTRFIRLLEDTVRTPVFLRPRRFGKSLWLSTLASYYDVAQAKDFERLFGNLDIGRNPTPLHNQYFILRWDFSVVAAFGDLIDLKQRLYDYLNGRVFDFNLRYKQYLPQPVTINPHNGLESFEALVNTVAATSHKLYLLIDEYDNFANEIAFSDTREAIERFNALTQTDGLVKSLFKAIKGAVGLGVLERVFITGMSPMPLADITSGFNIAQDITHLPEFHDLCGFREAEVADALHQVITDYGMSETQFTDALDTMRQFYDGYTFHQNAKYRLYNPTLTLYFLHRLAVACEYPKNMLDVNLSLDQAKLAYMARRAGGEQFLFDLAPDDGAVGVQKIIPSFRLSDMMDMQADSLIYRSLLYYLGVLTLNGYLPEEGLRLQIPNLVTRTLYFEQIRRLTLPTGKMSDEMNEGARLWRWRGDPAKLCAFVEQHFLHQLSNRDYLHFNEQTLKSILMAYLYDDWNYILQSEPELGRGYADLVMTVQPQSRPRGMCDLLIEFKYVKLAEVKLDGMALRSMSHEDVAALPTVQTALDAASAQVQSYAVRLRRMIGAGEKLRCAVVVAIGFERLVWRVVG